MPKKIACAAQRPQLAVRNARIKDITAIRDLVGRVYASTGMGSYTASQLRGHIHNFPEGRLSPSTTGASSATAPPSRSAPRWP